MIDLLDAPKSRTRIRAARVRSLAELFFRRLSQSTYARRREARRARPLYFESLESRILLSSDPILSAISHDAYVSLQDDTAIIDVAPPTPSAAASAAERSDTPPSVEHEDHDAPDQSLDAPQTFYVSLSGASNVTYDGPVTVSGIDVPRFEAPGQLHGEEDAVVAALMRSLDHVFGAAPVTFTSDRPVATEYSTIYVGGDGSAFASYGHYLGLSEKVDHHNLDHTDTSFVFSDVLPAVGLTASQYGEMLGAYVAHEAGHLLGFEHEHTVGADTDPLAEVAWKPFTHAEIAVDVRRDLLDDGMITLGGNDYAVDPRIVDAVRRYPSFFYGGAVGPDGFPDLVMGQSIIHPDSTGVWIGHVFDKAWEAQRDDSPYSAAEKQQILAWSYGFAIHAAGDMWAHTIVNEFADGVFPDFVNVALEDRARANAIR
ncbi:MAG: hypothetical protein DMD84_27695, partial [Candidatus Rokuibacteriota bacterium]